MPVAVDNSQSIPRTTMNTTDKAIINANTGLNYNGNTFTGGVYAFVNSSTGFKQVEVITSSRNLEYELLWAYMPGQGTINPVTGEPVGYAGINETNYVTAAVRPIVNLGIGPLVSGGSGTSSSPYVIAGAGTTTYTITYNANGGSGAPANQTATIGASTTISSTIPTRSNYSFVSWNTAANGSGTSYAPGATYTGTSNITLYAQWTTATYTVTLGSNALPIPAITTSLSASPNSGHTGDYITLYTVPGGNFATGDPQAGVGVRVYYEFTLWSCDNSTWTITNTNNNSTTVRVGTGNATITANYYIESESIHP
jgi:uncharacterized repeat protein (TIGR02543 family)